MPRYLAILYQGHGHGSIQMIEKLKATPKLDSIAAAVTQVHL